jgi:Uma2 family endonuclease
MATATEPRTTLERPPERFVLRDVGWTGYQTLLKMVENRRVRVTYHRGDVELMAPLSIHERYKSLIGRMIDTTTEELEIQVVAVGSTTFNSEELDCGLEPDECYYLTNARQVRDWKRVDLNVDPPPDLAVEVDITSSSINRQGIYANLRVPENWRFDGDTLTVLLLDQERNYIPSETSAAFPFVSMNELASFLWGYASGDDTRWGRTFREWVRTTLLPRYRDQGNA